MAFSCFAPFLVDSPLFALDTAYDVANCTNLIQSNLIYSDLI